MGGIVGLARLTVLGGAFLAALLFLTACGGSGAAEGDDVPGTFAPGPSAVTPVPTVQPTATSAPTATATPTSRPAPSPTLPAATPTATPSPEPTPTAIPDDAPVIVLDPGHDRMFPSALGIEYRDTLTAALHARDALEEAGYRVFLTREDNDYAFLDHPELLPPNGADFPRGFSHAYAHASAALQFDPDLVFVLHFNGNADPDVAGVELYYCENGGPQNLALAEIVREELVVALDGIGYQTPSARIFEDITVARGNRHVPSLGNLYDAPREYRGNRYAGIPVVLTEALYETNPTERALIEDPATHDALARAYVRAADRYFGR